MAGNIYGTYREVQATCYKLHKYLGMSINFSDIVKNKIDMVYYISNMIDKRATNITGTAPTTVAEDLFSGGKIRAPLKIKCCWIPHYYF